MMCNEIPLHMELVNRSASGLNALSMIWPHPRMEVYLICVGVMLRYSLKLISCFRKVDLEVGVFRVIDQELPRTCAQVKASLLIIAPRSYRYSTQTGNRLLYSNLELFEQRRPGVQLYFV